MALEDGRRFRQKHKWHFYRGQDVTHWVEPFEGERLSIVLYTDPGVTQSLVMGEDSPFDQVRMDFHEDEELRHGKAILLDPSARVPRASLSTADYGSDCEEYEEPQRESEAGLGNGDPEARDVDLDARAQDA